jgi:hypothetical protein
MRPAITATLGTLVLVCAPALLGACPTVDLGDQPPDPEQCRPDMQYFHDHIWPEYLAPADTAKSCVAQSGCHGDSTAFHLRTQPVDDAFNYLATARELNCAMPSESPLLTKPLVGGDPHGGGDVFTSTSDPAVVVFLGWFP